MNRFLSIPASVSSPSWIISSTPEIQLGCIEWTSSLSDDPLRKCSWIKDPWTWLTLLITHKLFFVRTLTLFSRYSKEKCKGRLFFPGLCRKASFEKFISIPIFLMHILSLVLVATVWAEGQLLESPLKWYSVNYARIILKFAHKNQGPTWRSFQSFSIFPTLE